MEADAHDLTEEDWLRPLDPASVEDDQEHDGKADVDEGVATLALHPDVAEGVNDIIGFKNEVLYAFC